MTTQPFDYYVVLEFEATCYRAPVPEPQEIIECSSLPLDDRGVQPVAGFQSFVRLLHHPVLTSCCIDSTGSNQERVEAAAPDPEVFAAHRHG